MLPDGRIWHHQSGIEILLEELTKVAPFPRETLQGTGLLMEIVATCAVEEVES